MSTDEHTRGAGSRELHRINRCRALVVARAQSVKLDVMLRDDVQSRSIAGTIKKVGLVIDQCVNTLIVEDAKKL